jgi:glycosyltransferase involved in cell wall biosynthesis
MKLVLILMVKNESRIIQRCLDAIKYVVDAVCICDTGSTDNTIQLAKDWLGQLNMKGCITSTTWTNFGENRTLSFQHAKKYLEENDWNLKETYGLLLDADMVFNVGSLKDQNLTEDGYTMIQIAGPLEYPNTRLVRMDVNWICKGVTHEYWSGITKPLGKEICYISDRNDGGCKDDKFTRDRDLLLKGLGENPDDPRYLFYLAQTYRCLSQHKDAIITYQRRIDIGGWAEETWHCYYSIGLCHKDLGDIPMYEASMLKAFEFRPSRAEPIYELTRHFRIIGQHLKSLHYANIGERIPLSGDSLFVDTSMYGKIYEYEKSILAYYIHSPDGLTHSINYLLNSKEHQNNVFTNMKFYVKPLKSEKTILNFENVFGENFKPSAISIGEYPEMNVRFHNYTVKDGVYSTADGSPVQTKNAFYDDQTLIELKDDNLITFPKNETNVKGLEDMRLYHNEKGVLMFSANSREYSSEISMVIGEYKDYKNCKVLKSPYGKSCEKNWLPIEETSNFIYDWHPFRLYDTNTEEICKRVDTPSIFSLFRGSAPPIKIGDEWWCVVHMVDTSNTGRIYYHCLVVLSAEFEPLRFSQPFIFKDHGIEYCISFLKQRELRFYVSHNDSSPAYYEVGLENFRWFNVHG